MRSVSRALALVALVAWPTHAWAASTIATENAYDRSCATRSERALEHTPVRLARIVGDPTTTPSTWQVADAAILARIASDPDIYSEVADVWSTGGHVAVVNIESRSLELREHASYCYRLDGTLARVQSTSSGETNIDDEARYFDGRGRIVASTSRLGLLYPVPGATISPDLRPSKPDIFLNVSALPFYALLRSG